MEKKIQSLADYLADLAEKYQFTEDEAEELQQMLEDIYDREDEDEDEYINEESEPTDQEPAVEPTDD